MCVACVREWVQVLVGAGAWRDWLKSRRATFVAILPWQNVAKVCKLLPPSARLMSKAKVCKLLLQLFVPIMSVHEKSCYKSSQSLTFLATLFSHKTGVRDTFSGRQMRARPET